MMGFIFMPKDMLTSDFDLLLKLNEYLWHWFGCPKHRVFAQVTHDLLAKAVNYNKG
ncbi:Uncharacterised protein [Legionella wadsworthii]|uniref:Uncharacterized protein n=1 Tax=Legionella wadsworthii TaxID=28088 RepID=A0A378LTZ2_9GAMM|nr:hypothetical protein [Legionella wadsworthii]STY30418.1 Uncharacterised protein [Legionella wadsworthii]